MKVILIFDKIFRMFERLDHHENTFRENQNF